MENILLTKINFDENILKIIKEFFDNKKEEGYLYCLHNEMFEYYSKTMYKVGKASNIANRVNDYNLYYLKSPEIKHQSCKNYYNDIAENIIFNKLRNYKMEKNREFIDCDLQIITNAIDETCMLLNNYNTNSNDIDTLKKIIVNIPSLLIGLSIIQNNINDIIKLFDNSKKNDYKCKNIIDTLCNCENNKDRIFYINKCIIKEYVENDFNIDNITKFTKYLNTNINLFIQNVLLEEEYINTSNIKINSLFNLYSKLNNYKFSNLYTDFFNIYEYNAKDKYNFSINIESIAKWFKMRKDHIKKTLRESYIENLDYKIIKNKPTGLKGKPSETILLTPKCFKLMAMQSKTKKSIEVREYYYELEQVIDQYKEYIIKGLEEKIKKLENNQKPIINPSKGIIYIIQTSNGIGHYKIGKTKDLRKRLNSYNGDKKDNIIPLYIYETNDIDNIEKCVKTYAKKFQYRKYKEVFKTDINMLKELINDCGDFNNKTNLKIKWNSKQKGGNLYIALYKIN